MNKELKAAVGIAVIAVAAVAASSAAQSFGHMYDWATLNREPHWRALLFPVSVDGMMVAATVVLYVDHRLNRSPHRLAYLLMAAGVLVSVSANVLHDWSSVFAAKWISGWGPLALFGSFELFVRFLRSLAPIETPVIEEEAAPVVEVEAAPSAAPASADAPAPDLPSQPALPSRPAPAKRPAPGKRATQGKPRAKAASQGRAASKVNDVELQSARNLDREHRASHEGQPIGRVALKAALRIGTEKAEALIAELKKAEVA